MKQLLSLSRHSKGFDMATIRKRGSKFQAQIRRQGFPDTTKTFHQMKDAKEWARLTEIKLDRHELAPDRKQLNHITLADLITRYRDEVLPNKKSREIETIVLNAFLRCDICQKTLSELNVADFATYRDKRLQDIKPISLKRQLAPIQNMFELAMGEWGIPMKENPLAKLTLKATDNKRERRLKDGEYDKLIQAARTRQNPYVEKVIIFAIETAMRRGEILSLHWDQVDLKRLSATILESKNGHVRTIPLTPTAIALLHGLERVHDEVFPITANALKMSWGRMLQKTDIVDLHFHDLRHEAVSRFFELGLTVPEVASISGHRDMRMLLRYAHSNYSSILRKIH